MEKRQKVLKGARIEVRKWEIAVSECGCVVVVKEREERREQVDEYNGSNERFHLPSGGKQEGHTLTH